MSKRVPLDRLRNISRYRAGLPAGTPIQATVSLPQGQTLIAEWPVVVEPLAHD